jgi:3-keto-disaccharide hydrolase
MNRSTLWTALAAGMLMLGALPDRGAAETFNFDSAPAGALPPGWTSAMTHAGGAPKWEVVADNTAPSKPNALAQLSNDPADGRFPLAILDKANFTDGELSVKFKTISGKVDQGAGLVWRYRDANNYYLTRANALEDNVVLYKVEKGRRSSIAPKGMPRGTYGVKHKVPSQTWNTLRVTFQGPQFAVYFNGQKLFEVEDSTFPAPGKVGLWTKADSVIHFDDFEVHEK